MVFVRPAAVSFLAAVFLADACLVFSGSLVFLADGAAFFFGDSATFFSGKTGLLSPASGEALPRGSGAGTSGEELPARNGTGTSAAGTSETGTSDAGVGLSSELSITCSSTLPGRRSVDSARFSAADSCWGAGGCCCSSMSASRNSVCAISWTV